MSGENKVSVRCVYLYVSFFLFYYGVLHGETKKKKSSAVYREQRRSEPWDPQNRTQEVMRSAGLARRWEQQQECATPDIKGGSRRRVVAAGGEENDTKRMWLSIS